MKKRVFLITGAAGFVGSVLVRRLIEQKQRVHVLLKKTTKPWRIADLLSNSYLHIHYDDLTEIARLTKTIQKIKPDVIYHLAARGAYPTQNDPQEIFQSNLMSLLHLFEATCNIPYELFINVGSSSEYGLQDQPMSELTTVPNPSSYYAISKLAATQLSLFETLTHHKPILTVRLFSVYGPYEESSRLVPTLIKKIHQGSPIALTDPPTVRDFIYIDDVVDFFLNIEALAKHSGEVFNLGTGKETSILEFVKTAEKALHTKVVIDTTVYPARSWDALHWRADMSHTFKLLHWRPQNSIEQGLQKTDEWFKTHLSLW